MVFSEEEKNFIIEKHFEGFTREQICGFLGIKTPIYITEVFKEKGLCTTGKRDRYPVNENYFSVIDSNEKAYWLGMMYSDGNIIKGNKGIQLQLKDKAHLEKFKEALGAKNHKITESLDNRWSKKCYYYHFSVKSKKLANDLNNLGCTPNKSLTLEKIPDIPEEFILDFVRGYFDGDGSIHQTTSGYRISFVGTQKFLREIQNILQVNTKISNQGTGMAYVFQVMGNKQLLRILDSLYKTSSEKTRLTYKYNIYLEFCNLLGASPSNLEI